MNGGNFQTNLSIFDGKNWERWSLQMESLFGFQDIMEIVKDGIEKPTAEATEVRLAVYKENKKKNHMATFYLRQSVDEGNFDEIAKCKSAKEALLEKLENFYASSQHIKEVNLQASERQYELLQMNYIEKIVDFFKRVKSITNQMEIQGGTLEDGKICKKIMCSLHEKYDYIVCARVCSKNVASMSLEELQSNLEARENGHCWIGRVSKKNVEQAQLAQNNKKWGDNKKWKKKEQWKGKKDSRGKEGMKGNARPESSDLQENCRLLEIHMSYQARYKLFCTLQ